VSRRVAPPRRPKYILYFLARSWVSGAGTQTAHHGGRGKAYDTKDFIAATRALNVTAHVTKERKRTPLQPRPQNTRHPGYAISLSHRWLVEKGFGWLKQTGPIRQAKLRRLHKVDCLFVFSCAAHNLMRLPKLIAHGRRASPMKQVRLKAAGELQTTLQYSRNR
jgi:hypothetical protein